MFKTEDIKAITVLKTNDIVGYKLKGKSKANNINRILIVKPAFIKRVAIKNIMKKINDWTYRLNAALSSDEDDDTNRVLGEAEMLKSMIVNLYAKYLGKESLDKIIKDIDLLVREFVKAKTVQNSYINKVQNGKTR